MLIEFRCHNMECHSPNLKPVPDPYVMVNHGNVNTRCNEYLECMECGQMHTYPTNSTNSTTTRGML
jgi:hypothetical protein